MRISGRRADGGLYLSMGARMAVLLRGDRVTPTLDEAVVEAMGPWEPVDNSYDNRKHVQSLLDRAKVSSVDYFALGGAGSGNFGHAGRPGQEGGSGPGGGGKSNDEKHAGIAAKHGKRSADAWKAAVEREGKQPFAGAHMVGGGQADPMIDFGGDVKRRSDWVEAIKNRGGTDDDVARFDEGVKEKTQERIDRGVAHPAIADQMREYVGKRNVLDELDEAAAEEAGRYWASPEGQRIKAEGATRKVHPGGKDKMSPARQKQHDDTVAYRKENRRTPHEGRAAGRGDTVSALENDDEDREARTIAHLEKVDTRGMGRTERTAHDRSISDAKWRQSHAGRAAGPGGPASSTLENRWAEPTDTGYSTKERAAYRATQEARKGEDYGGRTTLERKNPQSGNRTHAGRAAKRGGSRLSDDTVDEIINAAQEAAQWRLSGDSTAMQQNIHRNAVYRQTLPHLSAKLTGYVTDEDLFQLAEDMTDGDLTIVASAFGMDLAIPNFAKKDDDEDEESPFITKDEEVEGEGENPLAPSKDEEAVVFDQFHSLDESKDETKPVSEVAQATQSGEATAPPAVEIMNLMPVDPESPEGRKQRRGAMRDKIRAAAKSKGKTADTLDDAEITDEDLFAMAKELGVTLDEAPAAVVLIDNAARYAQLLSATTHAKHIHLAGGEHPFQYCLDTVVPSMADEGKAPDDPNAFCAWWKTEGPGAG